jgi:RNA polymerase sigma factor (sigma-70 family)
MSVVELSEELSMEATLMASAEHQTRPAESAADIESLLLAHWQGAYLLALRIVGEPHAAEDVVQEAFLNAVEAARRKRPDEPRTWLYRITINQGRKWLRSKETRSRLEATMAVTPARSEEDREMLLTLRSHVESLEEKYRLPLSLHYEQGMTFRDIASVIDVPEGTAKTLVARALDRLRQGLLREGATVSAAVLAVQLPKLGALVQARPELLTALKATLAGKAAAHATAATTGAGMSFTAKAAAAVIILAAGATALQVSRNSNNAAPAAIVPVAPNSAKDIKGGGDAPAETKPGATYGWRGNWTGLYPDATPVLEWGRETTGPTRGLLSCATKPADNSKPEGMPLWKGMPREWAVLSPLSVKDAVAESDQDQIPDEASLAPTLDEKVGELSWKSFKQPMMMSPTTIIPKCIEYDYVICSTVPKPEKNLVAYAHCYLWCERPGKVTAIAEHVNGMKVRVNGQPVYKNPQVVVAFGLYQHMSKPKISFTNPHAAKFDFELKKGWNRLLVKVHTSNKDGWNELKFDLRLRDADPIQYEDKNIVWATKLPEKTNSSPIVIGDRIFTTAEPDELLCLDKKSGKILWRRINGYFEATPEETRKANPAFKEIEPLAAQLEKEYDYEKGLELRRNIHDALNKIDPKVYSPKWDAHMEGHFAVVGFSTTPVSDGKNVYVFVGNGVVAAYDLDGNRKWIRRLPADMLFYTASPALIGNRLVVSFGPIAGVDPHKNIGLLHGLDTKTGEEVWTQPNAHAGIASLIPATINGVDVVFTQKEDAVRASDGVLLHANPRWIPNDTGWSPVTVSGNTMYHLWYGCSSLTVEDYSSASGDRWEPKADNYGGWVSKDCPKFINGAGCDRWSATAPLIHNNIAYFLDLLNVVYAVDVSTKKMLYHQELEFDPVSHYNAIPIAASATLGGKHIFVMDNQGTCVVFEPGPVFKQVAKNHLGTIVQRDCAIYPQEVTTYGAPVFDGKYMYLRGEQNMYCIGETK